MFLRLFFFIFKSNTIFNRTPFYNLKACLKRLISLHLLLEWQIKCLYVIILFAGTEKYPRGRRGGFAKALGRATGAGVRIPPSPPKTSQTHCLRGFFICLRLNLLLFAVVISFIRENNTHHKPNRFSTS